MQAWRTAAGASTPDLEVNVNVSARQLLDPGFLADVQAALDASGLPAGALTLEMTESMLLADPDVGAQRLHELRALGVSVALDDFGTGYSSLSHLKVLPVDAVKIDKSFVDDLADGDHGLGAGHRRARPPCSGWASPPRASSTSAQAALLREPALRPGPGLPVRATAAGGGDRTRCSPPGGLRTGLVLRLGARRGARRRRGRRRPPAPAP